MLDTLQPMTAGHLDVLAADAFSGGVQSAKRIQGQESDRLGDGLHDSERFRAWWIACTCELNAYDRISGVIGL